MSLEKLHRENSNLELVCVLSSLKVVNEDQVCLPFIWACCKSTFFPFIFCSYFSQFSSCLFSVSGDALDENHLHTG